MLLVLLILAGGASAFAQNAWLGLARAQSSPVAESAVVITGDEVGECTMPPRPAADFLAVDAESSEGLAASRGTPIATPAPPSGGQPADAATIDAVVETVRGLTACVTAGDFRRVAAFLTEDEFRRQFAGSGEEIVTYATPIPIPAELLPATITLSDFLVYPDGRVTVIAEANGMRRMSLYVKVGDRYLLDRYFELPASGTPTP